MTYEAPQDPFSTSGQTAQPGRRRPRLLLVTALAVGLAGALIALGTLAPRLLNGLDDAGSAASPAPSPVPSRANLGEHATCVLLIPTATDGANQMAAVAKQPDMSTVDWPKLRKTIKDLETAKDMAPPEMVDDIEGQIKPLEHLLALGEGTGKGRLELDEFRASGLRLAGRCAKYAS